MTLRKNSLLRLPTLLLIASALIPLSCAQVNLQNLEDLLQGNAPLTQETVAQGLLEALTVGTQRTSATLSAEGGFSSNALLRIVLPDELKGIESRLRSIGLGAEIDRFELQMNQAAERAAGEAMDVFGSTIRSMTIQDAFAILDGPPNAATLFFKERTSLELQSRFAPVVKSAMDQVGVYAVYTELVSRYNAIPLIKPVSVDLEDYIVGQTLNGMFSVLETEEQRIRQDPIARTTELLKRVFGSKDAR